MAERALPVGAVRKRAMFGLLDADGWTWATLKATFWFLFIIFMLGYIPNLAYYVTVSNTVEVGYNAIPIVNWCPTGNEDLECPAPPGTVLPWQTSPPQLALPEALSGAVAFQSGTRLYLIGGRTEAGALAQTLTTNANETGNFGEWSEGPALPEPRADAALAVYVGVPYVIGGHDASGAPTDTVFVGVVEEGRLTGWALADGTEGRPDLTLPVPIAGAGAVASGGGLLVMGGSSADGPVDAVYAANVGKTSPPVLGKWEAWANLPLPEPLAYPAAVAVGSTVYVAGGEGPDGATRSVYRIGLDAGVPLPDEATGEPLGWAIAPEAQQLPEPRARAAGFTANGALYVIGGVDAGGVPQASNLWTVPNLTTGDLPGWSRTEQTDLPEARAGAPIAAVGSTVFLFAGESPDGLLDSTARAGLSPQPPFFQLGLFGLTVPALSIKGEIGQQLGYINAAGAGTLNFVILIVIGLAFSRPAQSRRIMVRLSRGHLKPYPGDDQEP